MENIYIENEVKTLLYSNHPCDNITVADTDMKGSNIVLSAEPLEALTYPTVNLTLKNVASTEDPVITDGDHAVNLLKIR